MSEKADRLRARAYGHLTNAQHAVDAVAAHIDSVQDRFDVRTASAQLDDAQAQINQARSELLKLLEDA